MYAVATSYCETTLPHDTHIAAVFYPTRGAQHPAHRQRLSFELPKEALKLSLHDAAVVSTLIESVPSIDALLVEVDDARHDMKEYRLRVGTMIRTIGRTLKEWYPLAVLFAAAHAKARVELSAAVSATAAMSQAATLASPVDTSTCKVPTTASEQEGSISNIYLQPYVQLMHDINRLRLSNVHDERPLLDGDALVALVREYRATRGQSTDVKVGRWVGQVHELIIEWQLREGPIDDESMTCNAEACRRFIVELLDAGRIDVDEPSYKKNKSKTKAVTTAATPSTTATSKH